jgi:hypothetical protein
VGGAGGKKRREKMREPMVYGNSRRHVGAGLAFRCVRRARSVLCGRTGSGTGHRIGARWTKFGFAAETFFGPAPPKLLWGTLYGTQLEMLLTSSTCFSFIIISDYFSSFCINFLLLSTCFSFCSLTIHIPFSSFSFLLQGLIAFFWENI